MIHKDFYHLLLESFSQPVELYTESRNVPFTLYVEEQKLFVRNGKIIPAVLAPKKSQHLLSGLKKMEAC